MILAAASAAPDDFYYSAGRKHPLTPSDEWVGVAVEDGEPLDVAARELRQATGAAAEAPSLTLAADGMVLQKVPPGKAARLRADRGGVSRRPLRVYETPRSAGPVVETGEVLVQFKPHVSRERAEEILAAHGAVLKEPLGKFAPNGFRAELLEATTESAVAVANAIHETGDAIFSHPNFICSARPNSLPNDPLYKDQWYLRNTGQNGGSAGADVRAEQAWNIHTGSSGVSIAVLDDGIDTAHEDFAGKLLPGYDYRDDDADPRPASAADNHGTSCAGIALAVTNNGKGVAGMARGCRLVPVRVYSSGDGTFDVAGAARAFNELADDVDVMSCSWTADYFDVIAAAINHAATEGRGGKGCVIVFSAGNSNVEVGVTNPYSTLENVLCVGSSNKDDKRSGYSNFGPSLDVVAPSNDDELDVVTTDRSGSPGYNDTDYAFFGGTSAACPLVAGVAALLVSNEPGLTAAQVRSRIKDTATKIDSANAGYDATGHSDLYGHGRVNAARALGAGDTTAPTVSINTPANNANYSSLAQAGGGSGDVGTGVYHVRVVLARTSDGAWWNWTKNRFETSGFDFNAHVRPATGSSWSAALPSLPAGYYQLQAQAVDNADNGSGWVARSFSLGDLTGPHVAVTAPAHDTAVGTWTSIQGTATDTSGIRQNKVQFTLYQNGGFWTGSGWTASMTVLEAPVAGNGSWSYTSVPSGSQLRSGRYHVSASAYDNNNTASQPIPGVNQVHFDFDGTPPEIEILKPANGWTVNALPRISGTASDLVGQPSLYIIRLSDGAFWTASGWASGETAILETSYNAATNTWTSAGPLPQAGSWDPATALYDGYYNIIAFAYDNAGHETRTDSVVRVDQGVPTEVAVTSPGDSIHINGLPVVRGTASAVVEHVELFIHRYDDGKWWNGSNWVSSLVTLPTRLDHLAHTWSNSGTLPNLGSDPAGSLASGSYNIFVLAYDANGGEPARHDVVFFVNRLQSAAATIDEPLDGGVLENLASIRGTTSPVSEGLNLYLVRDRDHTYWNGSTWTQVQSMLPVGRDPYTGVWQSTGPLPVPSGGGGDAMLGDGGYTIIASAYDAAGNVAQADANVIIDNSGPELVSLEFLTNPADVTDSLQIITGELRAKDPRGFDYARVSLTSPSGDRTLDFYINASDLHEGSLFDGTYRFQVQLPRYLEPGTWLPRVDMGDSSYNYRTYGADAALPMPAGSPGTLEIVNTAGVDREPPQLVSLDISPDAVDVTASRQTVTVTAVVTDDYAGLEFGTLSLLSPSGEESLWGNLENGSRVSGTPQSGTYRFTIAVDRFKQPGVWTASLYFSDRSGRSTYHENSEWSTPFPSGCDGQLAISNSNAVDLELPVLSDFSMVPDAVDVSASKQVVTLTFRVTDDVGGLERGEVEFIGPWGNHFVTVAFDAAQRTSGSDLDGIYQVAATIPRQAQPGVWSTQVRILDEAGREATYGGFYGEPLPQELEVINTAGLDADPPTLSGLSLSPAEVDVTQVEQTITITLEIQDGGGGFGSGSIAFHPPGGDPAGFISAGIAGSDRIAGDEASGTYQVTCTVPQGAMAGLWALGVLVEDAVGNYRYYAAGDPYATPLPGVAPDGVQVVNGSGATGGYDTWMSGSFPAGSPASVTGADFDPDHDSISNLLEYAFNLPPLVSSRAGMPVPGIASHNGNRHLTLTFLRRTDDPQLTYTVLGATSMGAWGPADVELTAPPVALPDGVTERVTVRTAAPVSAAPRQFLRLQVDLE